MHTPIDHLVLHIAKRSRDGEYAVDAVVRHESTPRLDRQPAGAVVGVAAAAKDNVGGAIKGGGHRLRLEREAQPHVLQGSKLGARERFV